MEERTSFASGRYIVDRLLAEGGQKRVYLARDTTLDRDCVIAVLKQQATHAKALDQFQTEALLLRGLAANPHVIDVFDVGEEAGTPFLVSQYADGGDLRREIRDNPSGLALDRVMTIAAAGADALAAAHDAGIVHGDVTPANLWLSEGVGAQLGDFGLAAAVRNQTSSMGNLVGTAAYMAPEQALGQPWDFKMDLYALGIVMYEMATGRPPFDGGDPAAVVSLHINSTPVAPSWHRPEISPALDALILSLLEKLPENRPPGCSTVLATLQAIASQFADGSTTAPVHNPIDELATGVFVGREAELARLHAIVDGALGGARQLVFICGEAGIGKTRLVEQVTTYARLRRASVYWGRCSPGETASPFAPWIEILEALAAAAPDDALREDVGDGAEQVTQIVPDIGVRLATREMGTKRPSGTREQLFDAIAGWLRRVARRSPLVFVLEDVHWADETSVLLLQYLAAAVPDAAIAFAATYRDAEVETGGALGALTASGVTDGATHRVTVEGLELAAVRSFVDLATREDAHRELASAIYDKTEGNPLFISEIMKMLLTTDGIADDGALFKQQIPPKLGGVIARRLERLSANCRSSLTSASVIGREFDPLILQRVVGAELPDVRAALNEALASRLIEPAPGRLQIDERYVFSHALVRDALYDALSLEWRQQVHTRTAEALEDAYTAEPGPHLSAIAFHFREGEATNVAKAVDYSIRAGDVARRMFAFEEAVRHWDAAIELLGNGGRFEEQARLLQRASDILYTKGEFERSVAYVERALPMWKRAGNRHQLAGAELRLGRTFTTDQEVGDLNRAMKHLNAAIELYSSDERGPALGYAYAALASAHDRGLRTQDGLAAAREVRETAQHCGNSNIRALGLQLEGMFLMKLGRLREGLQLEDEAWDLADQIGDAMVGYFCAWNRGFREREYLEDPRRSIATHSRGLRGESLAQMGGDRFDLLMGLGEAHATCGELPAVVELELPRRNRRFHDVKWGGHWSILATECATEAERHRKLGNRLLDAIYVERSAIGLYHLGSAEDGRISATQSVVAFQNEDVGAEMRSRIRLCLIAADLQGDVDCAQQQLSRCDEIHARGEDWRGQEGTLEVARAATLGRMGLLPAASASFERAIGILKRYELVWEEAEAFRLWGRALSEVGEASRAMDKYRRAIDIYRRIGAAAPWIARIVREYSGADHGDPSLTLGD